MLRREGILRQKKGQIGAIYPSVLTIVLVGIALGIGLMVLSQFQKQIGAGSAAYNATNTTINAVGSFADWLPIIVLVIVAAIILGLLVKSFVSRKSE